MRQAATVLTCTIALLLTGMMLVSTFDGKWKVRMIPDPDALRAREKEWDETLAFTPTTFMAETFGAKNGFKPVSYEEDTRRLGPATFTAIMKSDTAGTAKWTGTMQATSMQGQLVWTKKDGTVLNYTFNGEKSNN